MSGRTSVSSFVCTTSSLQTEALLHNAFSSRWYQHWKKKRLPEGNIQWISLCKQNIGVVIKIIFKIMQKMRAMLESKSPGCFYIHTHTPAPTADISFQYNFEDGLLESILSFKNPFGIDKTECHAVL